MSMWDSDSGYDLGDPKRVPDQAFTGGAPAENRPDARIDRLEAENLVLRGLVATVVKPCHYCGAETMAKCPVGFPGCSLADDLLVVDDVMMTDETTLRFKRRAESAEAELADTREALRELGKLAKAARSQSAAPDYDEEAIRSSLWRLVDAVLERWVGQEHAE